MRIAVASTGLGHVTRGIEAWAADLAHALHERGVLVVLFKGGGKQEKPYERVIRCLQRDSPRTEKLMRIIPRRFCWRLGFGSSVAAEQTTFALSLLPHLRREAIDILHVQDPLVALIVHRARRLGLVRTLTILGHGTEESYDFLRKLTYLHFLTPQQLEAAREAGVWKPTWTAIPNFINTGVFRPGRSDSLRDELGIPRDALVVLTTAAIRRDHKRIDYLLDEFAHFLRTNLSRPTWLVVAGGWERETDELVQRGCQMLGDRVRFLVRFPRERMAELYRLADLFTLCSLREMLGIVLLEASASGLCCIVHRHPVMQWVVGPGGVSIDMAVPGSLAAALGSLLGDAGRRRVLGDLARQHCLENFAQDRVVDSILDYYRFVFEKGRVHLAVKLAAEEADRVHSSKVV